VRFHLPKQHQPLRLVASMTARCCCRFQRCSDRIGVLNDSNLLPEAEQRPNPFQNGRLTSQSSIWPCFVHSCMLKLFGQFTCCVLPRDDVNQTNRSIVPSVYPNIARSASVSQGSMRVTVEVTCSAPQPWPRSMSVVREKKPPFGPGGVLYRDPHAFRRWLSPRQFEDPIGVMIAAYQPFDSVEASKHLSAIHPAGIRGKIPKVPNLVSSRDDLIPSRDQRLVVRFNRFEPDSALAQDMTVPEMGVGGEESGHRCRIPAICPIWYGAASI
jgi:hypothetical protein